MAAQQQQQPERVSASDALFEDLANVVDQTHIEHIHHSQLDALEVLRGSNATLTEFNDRSEETYQKVAADFARATKLLTSAQGDLMDIFKRIRTLRNRIKKAYPEACPESFDDDLLPEEREEKEREEQERRRKAAEEEAAKKKKENEEEEGEEEEGEGEDEEEAEEEKVAAAPQPPVQNDAEKNGE